MKLTDEHHILYQQTFPACCNIALEAYEISAIASGTRQSLIVDIKSKEQVISRLIGVALLP